MFFYIFLTIPCMKREWTIKDPFPFLQRKKFKIRSKYSLFFFAFIKDLFPEMVLYCDILIPPSSIHSDATPIYIIEREMLFLYIFLAFFALPTAFTFLYFYYSWKLHSGYTQSILKSFSNQQCSEISGISTTIWSGYVSLTIPL